MPPISLIFDLDGTLLDSAPDIHHVANLALRDFGFPDLDFARVRSFIGHGVPHLAGCLLKASGQDPDGPMHAQMIDRFNVHYETATGLTRMYPHVFETLTELQANGHKMALCTNKPMAATRATIDHFNLTPFFDVVVAGDSLPTRKPDPAPLLHAHAALGGGNVLYIGDSEVDAETARRAALPFALFTEGYRKTPVDDLPHDRVFSDHAVLTGLVAAWPNVPAA